MSHFIRTYVQTRHGADMDTVTETEVCCAVKVTKKQVIEAILKAKPTWEKRGNRLYNGVGEPVKIIWEVRT